MSDGRITKIELAPGIDRNTTDYDSEGKWVDGDKVRFRAGRPEKLGGWRQPRVTGTVYGTPRDFTTLLDLDAKKYAVAATNQGLFSLDQDAWANITPVANSITTNNIHSLSSTTEFYVSVSGLQPLPTVGTLVYFSEFSLNDQVVSASTYQVTSINGEQVYFNSPYTFTASTNASSSSDIKIYLNAGFRDNQALFGWGAGVYGRAGWNEPVSADQALGVEGQLRTWTLSPWGEDIVACPENGNIYYWDRDSTSISEAYVVSNAPTQSLFADVSEPVRHIVAYGTTSETSIFDPLLIRWSDQEITTDWTASAANAAGSFRLQRGSKIVGKRQTKREALVWTDESAYSERYLEEFFFVYEIAGDNCGLISRHAHEEVNGVIYWMGNNAFFRYNGYVEQLTTTLDDSLFDRDKPESINFDQKEKIFAGVNSEFNEIWWFYPSRDSLECDRYVIYNYAENIWYDGNLNRTVWADSDVFEVPFAMDEEGNLYEHEFGYNADNSVMSSFIRSGDFDIEDGDKLLLVNKFIPDFIQERNLDLTFNFRKYPKATQVTKGPFTIQPNKNQLAFRGKGRQMNVEIRSSIYDGNYELGTMRLEIRESGER